MRKAVCILNHALTDNQVSDLKLNYGVDEVLDVPETIKKCWSDFPTAKELDKNVLLGIENWLERALQAGDVVVAQGEFGATFHVVDFALKHDFVPVHAVTSRVSREVRDGEIVRKENVFRHVCFRKYEVSA